jgi:hypothetical protein
MKQFELHRGRAKVRDVAFTFRMGAGFPGDVNRTHPASIEPAYPDSTSPPQYYGQPVLVSSSSHNVRQFSTSDTGVTYAYGCVVRPFPTQQTTTANYSGGITLGTVAQPPTNQALDVLRSGYIMAQLGDGTLTGAVKGGTVYVWCAASTGHHVQGNFEATASAGNTAQLDSRFTFNGVQDANGVVEISFNE